MKDLFEDDFLDNPTQRVPVCLCLDTSGSMRGTPIDELNKGIKLFYDSLKEDEVACYSAEVCIVTCGNKDVPWVRCMSDFSGLSKVKKVPELVAGGQTPMGDAVNLALDLLEKRKNEYKNSGIEYYQPWLVIMTDGRPGGDSTPDAVRLAQERATKLVNEKKLVVMPVWIGKEKLVDGMDTLQKFSPKNRVARLAGLNFKAFFKWLSSSVSGISQSNSKKFDLPPMDWTVL